MRDPVLERAARRKPIRTARLQRAVRLATVTCGRHMVDMDIGSRWRALGRNPSVKMALFGLGCALLVITPIIGILPGPGGVFTFAIGAGLMLKNSAWAKRRYVLLKRRWPKPGHWCDRGLRRPSARRRHAISRSRRRSAD
jgi:hypothetical protein